MVLYQVQEISLLLHSTLKYIMQEILVFHLCLADIDQPSHLISCNLLHSTQSIILIVN